MNTTEEMIFTDTLAEVEKIARELAEKYPLNDYNQRIIKAEVLRRLRAAIELTQVA